VVPIIISVGALVITVGPSLGHYYGTPVDEQWKEVAMYVEENSASDEVIVLASGLGIEMQQKTFDWYYSGISQNCLLSSEFTDPGAISKALRQCVTGHDRFWVIIPDYPSDPAIRRYRSFFLRSDQSDLHLIKEQQFVRISVYLFELTK
jgi:hypothetical protein